MGKQVESIIDTNIILRFLVGDNLPQQRRARDIFKEGEKGKRNIRINVLVIAEACFVLESFYKKTREDIADSFQVFLAQKWLLVDDRKTILSIWDYYKSGLHFVDSYILAWSKINNAEIITFDKKLFKTSYK